MRRTSTPPLDRYHPSKKYASESKKERSIATMAQLKTHFHPVLRHAVLSWYIY